MSVDCHLFEGGCRIGLALLSSLTFLLLLDFPVLYTTLAEIAFQRKHLAHIYMS